MRRSYSVKEGQGRFLLVKTRFCSDFYLGFEISCQKYICSAARQECAKELSLLLPRLLWRTSRETCCTAQRDAMTLDAKLGPALCGKFRS